MAVSMVTERGAVRRDDAGGLSAGTSRQLRPSFSKRTGRLRASTPNLAQPYTHTFACSTQYAHDKIVILRDLLGNFVNSVLKCISHGSCLRQARYYCRTPPWTLSDLPLVPPLASHRVADTSRQCVTFTTFNHSAAVPFIQENVVS